MHSNIAVLPGDYAHVTAVLRGGISLLNPHAFKGAGASPAPGPVNSHRQKFHCN